MTLVHVTFRRALKWERVRPGIYQLFDEHGDCCGMVESSAHYGWWWTSWTLSETFHGRESRLALAKAAAAKAMGFPDEAKARAAAEVHRAAVVADSPELAQARAEITMLRELLAKQERVAAVVERSDYPRTDAPAPAADPEGGA